MYPIGERFDDMEPEEQEEYLAELEDIEYEHYRDKEIMGEWRPPTTAEMLKKLDSVIIPDWLKEPIIQKAVKI